VARSVLITRLEVERLGEVTHVSTREDEVAGCQELLDRAAFGQGGDDRDRPTSIRDLDRLARLDAPQQFARPLPEFAYSNARHVLSVAHL
jgi:hypothetical protein